MPLDPRRCFRERWDEVTGRQVRSLQAGSTGPFVVVISGLGALGYLTDTLTACSAWARAFLLDVPGFGHRGPPACPAEIPAIAETVSAWLAQVADGPVVLVGHSTGAQAALRVAVAHPDRVCALALLGPTFPPEQRFLRGLVRGFVCSVLREPPAVLPATVPYYLRAGPRALLRFVRSAQRDQPEQLISALRCPTMLARGEHDAFAPQPWLDRLTAAAPDSSTRTVPGPHAFPFRRGELTAELIAHAARRTSVLG